MIPLELQAAAKQCLVACVFFDRDDDEFSIYSPKMVEALQAPNARLNDLLRHCAAEAPGTVRGATARVRVCTSRSLTFFFFPSFGLFPCVCVCVCRQLGEATVLPLARLAAWTDEWVRPLGAWRGPDPDAAGLGGGKSGSLASVDSLGAHLLDLYGDAPPPLRKALTFMDGPPTTQVRSAKPSLACRE